MSGEAGGVAARAGGQPSFRAGTHSTFLAGMLDGLRREPALRALASGEADDPVVAIADAWAAALDVLAFYGERVAVSAYLRTAEDRGAVLDLARQIGRELGPGVAASTWLAFTLDEPPPALPAASALADRSPYAAVVAESTVVPAGTAAQSVPRPGELPMTFETVAAIEARPAWNAVRLRPTRPDQPVFGDTELRLAGTATGLRVGDLLLLVGDERRRSPHDEHWDVRAVAGVRAVEPYGGLPAHTVVALDRPLGERIPHVDPAGDRPIVHALRQRAAVFGHNAMPWAALPAALRIGEWVETGRSGARRWDKGPYADREGSWADARFAPGSTQLDLDQVYPGIVTGDWVVASRPGYTELFTVAGVTEASRADYLLQGKVSRLTVSGENLNRFSPRGTTVYAASEPLPLFGRPVPAPLTGRVLELDVPLDGFPAGRAVAVRGRRHAAASRAGAGAGARTGTEPDRDVTEVALVDRVEDGGRRLVLAAGLANAYDPATVTVNANVAPATHGASRRDVLGSGDAALAFQSFRLAQVPLTHVAAATDTGSASTLEVRVDGVRWQEVRSLYAQPPQARVFVTRQDEHGVVTVRFGDGVTGGARLPTGRDNVVATYRVGTGLAAQVEAGRISLLMSRPLGVRDVVNPAPATGADDPESLERARAEVAKTVLTLGRIVALRDYEDFARSFAGVGKVAGALLWHGEQRVVHLTVAAADGTPLQPGTATYRALLDAIDAARHATHRVTVDPHVPRPVAVGLSVRVLPAHDVDVDVVLQRVRVAVLDHLSFPRREFAQPLTASDLLALVQRLAGVRGAVLTELRAVGTAPPVQDRVLARPARLVGGAPVAAELLTLDPGHLVVRELAEVTP